MRNYSTGATRDNNDDKLNWEGFISPIAMRPFAEYMHKHRRQADGRLRDADNWQKGMPRQDYAESLIRHTWDFWWAWRTKAKKHVLIDLLCAILFNVQGLLLELVLNRDIQEEE